MKLKEIKDMVKYGQAEEVTKELTESVDVLAVSHGIYGMNGALLKGRESGKLYGITARNTMLFRYV